MKKLVLFAFCLCSVMAFAQDEVSLVVSADGATKTQAIDNALRSAIEQTYGTFVSANTQILNDEMVKDEIATVSSGNIQKYTEIAAVTLPNGNTSVTLNVTVSLAKLISYAQSKGSQCEFAGATFGANMRLYEFNKKNERIAIENMIMQLNVMRPIFDYTISVSDPIINDMHFNTDNYNRDVNKDDYAIVKISVNYYNTQKSELFMQILYSTLHSLGKTQDEIAGLSRSGFKFFESIIGDTSLFFYNELPDSLYGLLHNIKYDFAIMDNNNSEYVFNYSTGLKRTFVSKGGRGREKNVSTVEWLKDGKIWNNVPFAILVNDLQKISTIMIRSTVFERTNYIYNNKSGYMEYALINGDQISIGYKGPKTCYRTSQTPHCESETILSNPTEVLHIIEEQPSCNCRLIGAYFDDKNIEY